MLSGKMRRDSQFEPTDHRNFNRHGESFDVGETFSGVDFGVRLTSVGEIDGSRDAGAKLLETTSSAIDARDDMNAPGALVNLLRTASQGELRLRVRTALSLLQSMIRPKDLAKWALSKGFQHLRVDGNLLGHYLGKPTPDWTGAFGADVEFLSNFSLNTLFEYRGGFTVTDHTGRLISGPYATVLPQNFRCYLISHPWVEGGYVVAASSAP